MKEQLPREVNFLNEVIHCKKIKKILKNKYVSIPFMYENLSTDKVLVMEFIDGYPITDVARLKEDGIPISDIALHLTQTFA